MGMLRTLVGSRVPPKYRKYFNLPERHESFAIPESGDTALGRARARWSTGREGMSGVMRLEQGSDALSMRIGLIDRAERSIDIQSYLIRDDLSGNLIALRLIEAANRGVRVRLLMDDALTEEIDGGLLSLNDHLNIEVRVFNPFPRRRSRFVSFIANFNVLNRRMHNKSFTVDNAVTIVGGRNLADEYYATSHAGQFLDEDLVAIGPVVAAVSEGFDEYWNTREAISIDVFNEFVRQPPIHETVAAGRRYLGEHGASPILRGVDDTLADQLLDGSLPLIPAHARVVLDHPDKVRGIVRRQVGETTDCLIRMVSSASREVIIVSPYFVPQQRGVEFFANLVKKGVRVTIITNSLASTNHSSVHAVYAWYRKPLLRQGIELYELRPRIEPTQPEDDEDVRYTLHSKVAVVDEAQVFVGSFNLDPRSLYINTEMGMVVQSQRLAQIMAHSVRDSLPALAYRLRLDRRGRLRWYYAERGAEVVVNDEPHTGLGRRVLTRLMGLLPIESQM